MITAYGVASFGVWGDHRHQHDDAVRGKHPCYPADPGDVDVAVLATEAQASGEMRSHLVAVQHLHALARGVQLLSESVGNGGLSS
jgi:hypothetical protein